MAASGGSSSTSLQHASRMSTTLWTPKQANEVVLQNAQVHTNSEGLSMNSQIGDVQNCALG